MKYRHLAIAAAAAVVFSATPALAATNASASFTNIKFSLFDLDTNDGITPTLTFASGAGMGSRVEVSVNEYDQFGGASGSSYGQGSSASSSLSRSISIPGGTAAASITGSGSSVINGAGNWTNFLSSMSASGSTSGPLGSPGSGSFNASASSPYYWYSQFTLSSGTLLVVSAAATLSAQTTYGYDDLTWTNEYAQASANISLSGNGVSGTGLQSSSDGEGAYASGEYWNPGVGQTTSNSRNLSAAFTNLSGADMVGSINLGVSAYGYSSVIAVPEPETYAMFLAGLGALGFMSRRRAKQAA